MCTRVKSMKLNTFLISFYQIAIFVNVRADAGPIVSGLAGCAGGSGRMFKRRTDRIADSVRLLAAAGAVMADPTCCRR